MPDEDEGPLRCGPKPTKQIAWEEMRERVDIYVSGDSDASVLLRNELNNMRRYLNYYTIREIRALERVITFAFTNGYEHGNNEASI